MTSIRYLFEDRLNAQLTILALNLSVDITLQF